MFHIIIPTVLGLIPAAEPTPTTPPVAGGHSPINPTANGNFPGGALIKNLVDYALYAGYAAALIGFIAGAATIWLTSSGRMNGGAHQFGVRALIGSVVGGMLLASIGSFI